MDTEHQPKSLYVSLLCAGIITACLGVYAWAAPVYATDSSTAALTDQLKDINAKIKAYNDIVKLKQKLGATLQGQLDALEAQASRLEVEIRQNEQDLFDIESDLKTLTARIAEKERILDQQRRILTELLRQYYAYTSQTDGLIMLASETGKVYLSQEEWMSEVGERVGEVMQEIKQSREEIVKTKLNVETKKTDAETLRIKLGERNDYLASTKQSKSVLLTQAQQDQTKYASLVDQLKQQREDIEQEIEDIESGKVSNLDLSKIPKFKKGLLAWPIDTGDFTMSQGYGKTSYAKKAYKSGFHNGVDLAASTGTVVKAPLDGRVVGMGNAGKYAYGKWIAIDHGNGLTTLYGHLSSQGVKKGQKVKADDAIGRVGSTGYSTGSHLHFTVFSSNSFELVESSVVKGLMIPVGATINPTYYLP